MKEKQRIFLEKVKKKERGITLIAMVITIIILLIIAGISIEMITGDNGILSQAESAVIKQSHGAVKEGIILAYNEYQIEINTASNEKLASTEKVMIKGNEEKSLNSNSISFLDFLVEKGYADGETGVLDVEKLTGSKQSLGNGTDTDVYKLEEEENNYVVNYYDEDNKKEEIWSIEKNNNTEEEIALEPDTGKEELILVYNVNEGDTIELPYNLKWMDSERNEYDAEFNFTVDWGDGSSDTIASASEMETKARHTYNNGEVNKEVKITIDGIFECLCIEYYDYENEENIYHEGYDKLIRVDQWGTTGLKYINLEDYDNLTQIVVPTESSFKDLVSTNFSGTGIQSIPDKMFMNCTKITSFASVFYGCDNLQTIGDYAFSNCSNVTDFGRTFSHCINLTKIGKDIFSRCNNVEMYNETFLECANLTGKAPELWLTGTNSEENNYKGEPNGNACFYNCTKLDNYNEIPEYWKREPDR